MPFFELSNQLLQAWLLGDVLPLNTVQSQGQIQYGYGLVRN